MGIEVKGKLYDIFETKQVSERFRKREFVLELGDNPRYPQLVLFQMTGDRCEQLDGFEIDDDVKIEFSLRGREWRSPSGETKYFNTLDVWKLDFVGAKPSRPPKREEERGGVGEVTPLPIDDDIPFASCELAHEPSPIARSIRRP